MLRSKTGSHLVHCFDEANGEDGEEQAGDQLEANAENFKLQANAEN